MYFSSNPNSPSFFVLAAFHNFEHASTVLGAVNKVVSLANPPEDIDYTDIRFITTDPWTHFALVFSALIHGKVLLESVNGVSASFLSVYILIKTHPTLFSPPFVSVMSTRTRRGSSRGTKFCFG
jgi:hypothetical protein